MSKKCRAFSVSKLGLESADNRKAFYAGWDAAIEQAKKQEPWVWQQAPIKTQWGDDMVVADLAIDKDHTVSVYCEKDQTARVEAMFKGKTT